MRYFWWLTVFPLKCEPFGVEFVSKMYYVLLAFSPFSKKKKIGKLRWEQNDSIVNFKYDIGLLYKDNFL